MSALDRYHTTVRSALIKDGWTITDDPLQLLIGRRTLSVDLGAERVLIGAERDKKRIAVEIKTFGGASPVADLQQTVGQFVMYKTILSQAEPDRELYLAVSEEVRDSILTEELGRLMLEQHLDRLFYFFGGTRGDCRMETLETLHEAIRAVFAEWEKLPRIPSDWKIVGVQDAAHERYTLQHVSFTKDRYDTRLLAYLEIRDGKIWMLTDNTEEGIAAELVAAGIPKDRIVLGFYSPGMREMGEFAVA